MPAALTPTSLFEISLGSPYRLVVAKFASVNNADTWTTVYSPGIVDAWAQNTGTPGAQALTGIALTIPGNSGGTYNPVIALSPAQDGMSVTAFLIIAGK